MIEKQLEIINRLGLHARAAAKLVRTAAAFESRIELIKDEKSANAKSIMSLMMLAAAQGSQITLRVDGADEAQAMQAVEALIADRFGEGQ